MATYTIYIVTRNARHHYPVIMANNGKAILNEPVKRAWDLEKSANSLIVQAYHGSVTVERITEKAFKAKFPKFAANKGPKKKDVKAPKVWVPKPGQKFVVFQRKNTVDEHGWMPSMDKMVGKVLTCMEASQTIIHVKGSDYVFHPKDIKPAPAKRITKKVTNPVK